MKKLIFIFWFTASLALANTSAAEQPMPPGLNLGAEPQIVLAGYPIGRLAADTARLHYGGPHKTFSLINGLQGWLYNVGTKEWHRSYTLVVDSRGVVVDVLYYDHSTSDDGLSALQVQSREQIAATPPYGAGPKEK